MKIKRYVRTILVCLFICLYVITDVALASNSQQSADVGTPKDSVVNKELGRYQEQPISLYTQVHLDFIGGQKYKDRMNNTWAEIIYDGLTGFGSDAAEALYDILDTPSDLLNFQKPSVFENPYDEIMMILIRSEAGFSENTINLEYDRTLYDCVCDIKGVCDAIDPEWQMEDADFYEQFTELLNYADTVEDQNPEFYKKVLQLFSGNEEVIKDALNTFGNVSFFFDRVSDTVTVLNAVFDTVKYNATVKAYINCSNMFKEYLSDIEKTMEKEAGKNASKKRYTPQIKQYDTYASQFKSAKEKYDRFLTDDVIADEILKEYMKEQVIDTTVLLAGLTDDFCENIALNFVTKALDLSKETAQYVFAAVEAYKTGWAISEFLTGNETNMECRELARAYYYLENACVLTVKEYQGWLELNKQEKAAFKFDTAYRSLQTIECATLANYKEYLQAQDASLLRRVINFFTKHSNDDEIKICEQYASEWEDEKCHVSGKDFTSIAGQIVDKNDIPVEGLLVTISTDKTKNVVFSGRTDADGHFCGEIKKGSEGLSIRVSDDNGMLLEKMLPGMVKYGHNELGVIKLNYFESAMTIGIASAIKAMYDQTIADYDKMMYKGQLSYEENSGKEEPDRFTYYTIADIDNNGVDELIIRYDDLGSSHFTNQNSGYGESTYIYTVRDGKVVKVLSPEGMDKRYVPINLHLEFTHIFKGSKLIDRGTSHQNIFYAYQDGGLSEEPILEITTGYTDEEICLINREEKTREECLDAYEEATNGDVGYELQLYEKSKVSEGDNIKHTNDTIVVAGGYEAPKSDFIFWFSSERAIEMSELDKMTPTGTKDVDIASMSEADKQIRLNTSQVAIDEIYARHGMTVADTDNPSPADLYAREHFNSLEWYRKANAYYLSGNKTELNDIEKNNISLLYHWQHQYWYEEGYVSPYEAFKVEEKNSSKNKDLYDYRYTNVYDLAEMIGNMHPLMGEGIIFSGPPEPICIAAFDDYIEGPCINYILISDECDYSFSGINVGESVASCEAKIIALGFELSEDGMQLYGSPWKKYTKDKEYISYHWDASNNIVVIMWQGRRE